MKIRMTQRVKNIKGSKLPVGLGQETEIHNEVLHQIGHCPG